MFLLFFLTKLWQLVRRLLSKMENFNNVNSATLKKMPVMNIEIREDLTFRLYGLSGVVHNFKYGETGVGLMNKMGDIVEKHRLPGKGINIWIYDSRERMFTGVEMATEPKDTFGLEVKDIVFKKYAWYKHLGPYELLYSANEKMREELQRRNLKYGPPFAEIYGHHHPDVQKLETEIIYTLY
jgi:hypothetical protein